MKKVIVFIITFIICFFSSCNVYNSDVVLEKNKEEEKQDEISSYILKFDYNIRLNKLEPENDILLGLYFNRNLYYGIEDYQGDFSKEANHYVYEYILGTEFETNYLLDCIARDKIAFIKLIPSKYTIYDLEQIQKVANILDAFNIDAYIELFPNPKEEDYNPKKYKDYFEKSSSILKSRSSDTSIIFTPASEELISQELFCPAYESFDFVGFNYVGNITDNKERIYPDFFNKFNFVYNTYSFKKPIFITTFAVSFHSNKTNTYYVNENIKFINGVIDEIEKSYNRVKGINFYDIDVKEHPFDNDKYNNDDYRISENETILENFNQLIGRNIFISKYSQSRKVENKVQYSYDAISVNEKLFVSETVLLNENIKNMNYPPVNTAYYFKDETYYPVDYLFSDNYSININNDSKVILVQ